MKTNPSDYNEDSVERNELLYAVTKEILTLINHDNFSQRQFNHLKKSLLAGVNDALDEARDIYTERVFK